jgi:1,4-dihydroxy-2-naphthoyl-CoA hydrolase
VISDEKGKRLCSARLTCLLRDVNPSDEEQVRAAT